jgi:DNA invertase Pin-like site-specific DNA recombinase
MVASVRARSRNRGKGDGKAAGAVAGRRCPALPRRASLTVDQLAAGHSQSGFSGRQFKAEVKAGARDHARRQREGIAKAKGEGEYTGRAPTARAKSRDVPSLGAEGMTREVIVAQLKTGVASVCRGLKAA